MILVCELAEPELRSLPRVLARLTESPVRLFLVQVTENDPDGVAVAFVATRVAVDGVVHPITREEDVRDAEEEASELLATALWGWLSDEVSLELVTATPLDLVPLPSSLSPRLQQLVRDVRAAGAWSAAPEGERWKVQLTLPDGSRRLSVLQTSELEAVARASAVRPELP
ncbi:MAG: hypothetical protein H6724_07910 [Sandaracinus sp.]|nr:hypothetical protein [Sandaracinus sp.]